MMPGEKARPFQALPALSRLLALPVLSGLLILSGPLLSGCTRGAAPPTDDAPVFPTRQTDTDMVLVSAGPFLFGSDEVDTENRAKEFGGRRTWYADEHPLREVTLPAYLIDRTEVTEGQYQAFLSDVNYPPPPHWEGNPKAPADPDLPVTHVTWMDAQNYCHWRGDRLPSEREWEKAARGTDGRRYPWGNTFDRDRTNVGQTGGPAEAGHFTASVSPFGAVDMAGNVWEWTSSWYLPYPGNPATEADYGKKFKVLRGGSAGSSGGHYILEELTTRTSYRFYLDPRTRAPDAGFRCARSIADDGTPIDDRDRKLHD